MYSETSLLWTFLDPEFLATFCCNVEVSSFRGKICINQTCWDQHFCPYYGGIFSIASLIQGVC